MSEEKKQEKKQEAPKAAPEAKAQPKPEPQKKEAATQEKMSGLVGGMNLPPGMKLPF